MVVVPKAQAADVMIYEVTRRTRSGRSSKPPTSVHAQPRQVAQDRRCAGGGAEPAGWRASA